LITGDSRGLYYGRPFISQSLYDEPLMVKFAKEEKDPAAIGHRLKELGVDYLVVNAEEGVRAANDGFPYGLTSLEWKKLDDFFRQGLEPIYYQGFQAVYQIRQTPNEGRGYFVENPLLFCSAPAARFAKDNGNGSLLQTESDLQEVLSLYDFSPFWWERMARVEGQLGKKAEEYESFEKADTLGPLHPENYKRWMEAAKEAGNPGRAAYIEREARKWYPQLFQNLKN
jgi:hypothetical protein